MENQNIISKYSHDSFGEVRVITKDGEPWFVAADVCRALEIKDTWNAMQRLDEDEKGACSISTLGGMQEMFIVNEPGLYSLVLGSRKPEAKTFKRWITHEVIPAIRKNGVYVSDKINSDMLFQIAEQMRKKEERIQALSEKNAEMLPKAQFYDTVTGSPDTIDMAQAAKVLNMGMGRNTLFKLLREKNILQSNNIPYQSYIDRGYFRCIESQYTAPDGTTHISIKTVIFQKGLDFIRDIIRNSRKKLAHA